MAKIDTLLWVIYRAGGLDAVGKFFRALDAAGVSA
jgi:hypothetical protein